MTIELDKTTDTAMTFEEWFAEVKRIAVDVYKFPEASVIPEDYRFYWDNCDTPLDAFIDENDHL